MSRIKSFRPDIDFLALIPVLSGIQKAYSLLIYLSSSRTWEKNFTGMERQKFLYIPKVLHNVQILLYIETLADGSNNQRKGLVNTSLYEHQQTL